MKSKIEELERLFLKFVLKTMRGSIDLTEIDWELEEKIERLFEEIKDEKNK